jgi:hypothetical protein
MQELGIEIILLWYGRKEQYCFWSNHNEFKG